MRFNTDGLTSLVTRSPPDWEGRLCYKAPKLHGSTFKERYFKLIGNLFYCLRVGPDGKVGSMFEINFTMINQSTVVQMKWKIDTLHF